VAAGKADRQRLQSGPFPEAGLHYLSFGELQMSFTLNRHFRRDYDRLYRKDPAAANVFLLLCELADEKGQVRFESSCPETEIQRLMAARFNDPKAYQLPGGAKR